MARGGPFQRQSDPPRDVTLRCDLTVSLEYGGESDRGEIDLSTPADWCGLFRESYDITGCVESTPSS